MFIYIGNDNLIKETDIVAIIDLGVIESSTIKKKAIIGTEEQRKLYGNRDDAKSIVITTARIYYSNFSVVTLKKRAGLNSVMNKIDDYTDKDLIESENEY